MNAKINPVIAEPMRASLVRAQKFVDHGIAPIILNEMTILFRYVEAAFGHDWHAALGQASYYRARGSVGLCAECDRDKAGYCPINTEKPLCSVHLAGQDQVLAQIDDLLDRHDREQADEES